MQLLEKRGGDVRGGGSRGSSECDGRGGGFCGEEDRGDVGVEGEGFAPTMHHRSAREDVLSELLAE